MSHELQEQEYAWASEVQLTHDKLKVGVWTLHTVENLSVSHCRFSVAHESHGTIVFTIEKNLCIHGPVQLKPAVFRGQLCMFLYAVGQILIFLLDIIQK